MKGHFPDSANPPGYVPNSTLLIAAIAIHLYTDRRDNTYSTYILRLILWRPYTAHGDHVNGDGYPGLTAVLYRVETAHHKAGRCKLTLAETLNPQL
jgi:hypothetical protein